MRKRITVGSTLEVYRRQPLTLPVKIIALVILLALLVGLCVMLTWVPVTCALGLLCSYWCYRKSDSRSDLRVCARLTLILLVAVSIAGLLVGGILKALSVAFYFSISFAFPLVILYCLDNAMGRRED